MSYSIGGGWEHDLDRWLTTDPRDEEEPVCYCTMCENGIYEGEEYYNISGNIYCERCIDDCRTTAEVEDE